MPKREEQGMTIKTNTCMHEKRLESPVTLPDMSTWSDKNLPSQWTQQTG